VKAVAKAFAPSGISSFFEICDTRQDGKPISNPEKIGARGGGFVAERGVLTEVKLSESEEERVTVFINGKLAKEAETTKTVARTLLSRSQKSFDVNVHHAVEAPIGAGFGSSAAGALSTALALSKALRLNLTYNDLGRIAHVSEVQCKTGLGTVGALMLGGCIITREPGTPENALIDRIPIPEDYMIVAGIYGPIPTKSVLSSQTKRLVINKWGRKTLEKILEEPSLENFMKCCHDFAEKTGFMTKRLQRLTTLALEAGAIGAAQNMVGEVIHAIVDQENAKNVAQAFRRVLPEERVWESRIDLRGARIVS
jgi:pantoate kinase